MAHNPTEKTMLSHSSSESCFESVLVMERKLSLLGKFCILLVANEVVEQHMVKEKEGAVLKLDCDL